MRNQSTLLLLSLLLTVLFSTCEKTPPSTYTSRPAADLTVVMEGYNLRSRPAGDADIIDILQKGDTLWGPDDVGMGWQQHLSDRVTKRGVWLSASDSYGRQGWVLSWVVAPRRQSPEAFWRSIHYQALKGESFKQWEKVLQDEAERPAARWEALGELRGVVESSINDYFGEKKLTTTDPPNWYWLADSIPGLVPQWSAAQGAYRMELDYRYLAQLEAGAISKPATNLLTLAYQLYPDSISDDYYEWQFPVSDTLAYSLLGSGKHLAYLRQMNEYLSGPDPMPEVYRRTLLSWQSALYTDAGEATAFWLPKAEVKRELTLILQEISLTEAEKEAIERQIIRLSQPKRHNLRFNFRSGQPTSG